MRHLLLLLRTSNFLEKNRFFIEKAFRFMRFITTLVVACGFGGVAVDMIVS